MKIKYRHGKATIIFALRESGLYDIRRIKSHHIETYCGCKCIEISKSGFGTMQLCSLHEERASFLGVGATLTPEMRVNIPLTFSEQVKSR